MTELDAMRALCRELGGGWVDLWSAPEAAGALLAHRRARGLRGATAREVARDVVSTALIEAARGGDGAARDRLVALWRADVLHWARWLARRDSSADDIAQEAMVRMCEQLDRLHDPERFRAWLWGLVRNVAREHGRTSVWRRCVAWLAEKTSPPDPRDGAETALARAEQADRVQEALRSLEDGDRELLWLHYVDGLGRDELAAYAGLPRGSLNRRMTEARRAFEQAMARLDARGGGRR